MSIQSIPFESVDTADLLQVFGSPLYTVGTTTDIEALPTATEHSFDQYDSTEIKEIISRIAVSVLHKDPDERLDFVAFINPTLTDQHLEQIAAITDCWLDDSARDRIRAVAKRCFDNQANPQGMISEWNSAEEIHRLVSLLMETQIPDKTLGICYAMSAAYDVAYAAYFIHLDRQTRRADFSTVEQTPEEVAADLRFASFQ